MGERANGCRPPVTDRRWKRTPVRQLCSQSLVMGCRQRSGIDLLLNAVHRLRAVSLEANIHIPRQKHAFSIISRSLHAGGGDTLEEVIFAKRFGCNWISLPA